MSLPNEVIVSTSKLTALGDAIRSRFDVSGDLTLDEMASEILSGLPSVYQRVEYIQSDGNAYINTWEKNFNGVYIDFQPTRITNGDSFFGALTDNAINRYDIVYWDGLFFSCGNGSDVSAQISNPTDRIVLSHGIDSNDLVVNGTTLKTYPSFSNASNADFIICGRNKYLYSQQIIKGLCKVWECRLYKDGVKKMHFVPCYRKEDGLIGMYDILNGQFHSNAGSGSFTCYPAPPSN